MCNKLRKYLNDELNTRGWSHRELSRRAGISQTQISGFLAGERGIGLDFCKAISKALGEPPEKILDLADLLKRPYEEDHTFEEMRQIMKHLSPRRRRELLEQAYLHFRLQKEEGDGEET